ncbi:Unknown protein sequence [Pseudomonas amygdali pv. mori]|uniref:Uncharacterized protein n=1 Tax=Pseudomonas amygdali pv. mori TaxID=34065 RepID=A0A0P9VVT0_PSEA0|nr:Unknown protein sequence [Pseudomonas amygdali pv. mori]
MYAKAQKAQRCGVENGRGKTQRCLNDQRCHAVGQHGDEHQAWQGGTGQTRSRHVVTVQLAHYRSAGQTYVGRQRHDGDGDHGVDQARAENCHDGYSQQQRWQGQHDVHQAHYRRAQHAREEARQQAQQDARDQRHDHRCQTDQQRQARTLDQTRQQIAAQFVGAEDELPLTAFKPHRRCQQEVTVLLARVMGRNPRGEQGAEHDQNHEQQAGNRAFVFRERLPEFFVRGWVKQALIDCYRRSRGAHIDDLSADDGCVGWQSRRGYPPRS